MQEINSNLKIIMIWLSIPKNLIKNDQKTKVSIIFSNPKNKKFEKLIQQSEKTKEIWFLQFPINFQELEKEKELEKELEKKIIFHFKIKNGKEKKIKSFQYQIIIGNDQKNIIFEFFRFKEKPQKNDSNKIISKNIRDSVIINFMESIIFPKNPIQKKDILFTWQIILSLFQKKYPKNDELQKWLESNSQLENTPEQRVLLLSLLHYTFNPEIAQSLLFPQENNLEIIKEITMIIFDLFNTKSQENQNFQESFKNSINQISTSKMNEKENIKLIPYLLIFKKLNLIIQQEFTFKSSEELFHQIIILLNIALSHQNLHKYINQNLFISIFGQNYEFNQIWEEFIIKLVSGIDSYKETMNNFFKSLFPDHVFKIFAKTQFSNISNFIKFWFSFNKNFTQINKQNKSNENLPNLDNVFLNNFSIQRFIQSNEDFSNLNNFSTSNYFVNLNNFSNQETVSQYNDLSKEFKAKITSFLKKTYQKVDKKLIIDSKNILQFIPFDNIQFQIWKEFFKINVESRKNKEFEFIKLLPDFIKESEDQLQKISLTFKWYTNFKEVNKNFEPKTNKLTKLLEEYIKQLNEFKEKITSDNCSYKEFKLFTKYKNEYLQLFYSLSKKEIKLTQNEENYTKITWKLKLLENLIDFYLDRFKEFPQINYNNILDKIKQIKESNESMKDIIQSIDNLSIDFNLLEWIYNLQLSETFQNIWNSKIQKLTITINFEDIKNYISECSKEWKKLYKQIKKLEIKFSEIDFILPIQQDKNYLLNEIKFFNSNYQLQKNEENEENEENLKNILNLENKFSIFSVFGNFVKI
ncbi:holocentric chromosome binding protein [Anaeramoeba ignava]|uniref:Holocentric chromosome binding protein n=1 Tax=Anaeramoeba ignava TaxID=1746090 RepID=A0A9Q0LCA3_ANAIG|nr:holocentric chromosome binding protein [Anaeramoeba ignava]